MGTKEYLASLPKKRMGAGALIFNSKGQLLIERVTYKADCEIPGGVIEENESPREACEREIREGLGIDMKVRKLLCVDYQHATQEKTESIMFVFDGGILTDEMIAKIKIDKAEISEVVFANPDEAISFLRTHGADTHPVSRRVEQALKALKSGVPVYLENREII